LICWRKCSRWWRDFTHAFKKRNGR